MSRGQDLDSGIKEDMKVEVTQDMGMTDSQWKDFIEAFREDLEELNEYKESQDEENYKKKYKRIMSRLDKSLKR